MKARSIALNTLFAGVVVLLGGYAESSPVTQRGSFKSCADAQGREFNVNFLPSGPYNFVNIKCKDEEVAKFNLNSDRKGGKAYCGEIFMGSATFAGASNEIKDSGSALNVHFSGHYTTFTPSATCTKTEAE